MEAAGSPLSEKVVCECGAALPDASSGAESEIVCEVCGRALKAAGPAVPAEESGVNAWECAVSTDPRARIRVAAAFVNKGKYVEALALYKWVHDEEFEHRDALYGMGFCYYKLGYLDRSQWLLERAQELDHPTAGKLLRKVLQKLEAAPAATATQA